MSLGPQFKNTARNVANAGLVAGMVAAVAVSNSTHTHARLADNGSDRNVDALKSVNEPTWNRSLSRQFEGFHDMSKRPKDAIATHVVGVDNGNDARVYHFDKAWDRNHDDNQANNLWVVGGKW